MRVTSMFIVALALSAAPLDGAAGGNGADVLWEVDAPVPDAGSASVLAYDADGDQLPDLLITSRGREGPWWTASVDGKTGDVVWRRRHECSPDVCVLPSSSGRARVFAAVGREAMILDGTGGDVLVRTALPAMNGTAAVGEMDGDGIEDIVVAVGEERNDLLLALSGVDLHVLFELAAEPDDSRMGNGFGEAVAFDTDLDGRCEVYVVENTDHLTKVDADGGRVWSVVLDERGGRIPRGAIFARPVLADVTGDGLDDLCVGCLAGRLAVLDPLTGEVIASRRFGVRSDEQKRRMRRLPRFMRNMIAGTGEPVNEMLPVELNGSPGLELVFGCGNGRVYAYSPSTDEELWSVDSGTTVYEPAISRELDGDGVPDLLAWHYRDVLLIDGREGTLVGGEPWLEGVDLEDPGTVMLEDVDGDGLLEGIFSGHGARTVFAWRTGLEVQ